MKNKKLKKAKNIYMIGIKGVGMTPVAQILKEMGKNIFGSDTVEVFFTDKVLKRHQLKFAEGFNVKNIPEKVDLVIHSSAFSKNNNVEMAEITRRKIPALTQAEALAELFNAKQGIAVCGSHGKTTTSALLGFILREAGFKPTVEVGSCVPQFKGNAITGSGKLMVIEADEYQNKLKLYNPQGVLLNNIDYDHPDYFKTPAAYQRAFAGFVQRVPKNGFVVANFDDEKVIQTVKNCRCKVISYGSKVSSIKYQVSNIKGGFQYFNLWQGKKNLGEFKMKLIGEHNVQNATAVIAACLELKAPVVKIKKALAKFKGTARRMEKLGKYKDALFIDDYAHHPTEIKATLKALRQEYAKRNIICAFMPHMFSRTKALLADFARSFGDADEILILPTYSSARENKTYEISKDLVKKIGNNAKYVSSIKQCADYLKKSVKKNDVIILMGAGDTFRVWDKLQVIN
ncbi:UDP-N-acetylmuramate--L-alanine ligase [Candidatus Falkowbacteria bacterium CG10_big_fil_rev_8_21_14_0_10_43_10]|uniref:UDP-N-acetylmuramate--L-alanine ligase n=1 Tax=Candidatus Falkowbacteria bacterium CG10_big_fil_rev_8_21_14_0_10_43_10 TaxID=1974567 RepID=A0A2H0V1N2_9BACT|nr:MAG: UDP-N-acetylmuramate--L-alanine ligase [Candidatus Falkowbacteria bacterium CG10_big_fil_rev_8_21_14_0_10_43_10]